MRKEKFYNFGKQIVKSDSTGNYEIIEGPQFLGQRVGLAYLMGTIFTTFHIHCSLSTIVANDLFISIQCINNKGNW